MQTKKESISIVIPNYNNEKYLRACIASVSKQAYPVKELIIVDDCSTDQSIRVIMEAQQQYNNIPIRLIALDKNEGVSHARNVGIQGAEGEYITFLDADDCCYDEFKIANEMALIFQYKEIGKDIAAYSKVVLIDENGELIRNTKERKPYSGKLFMKLLKTVDTAIVPRDYCIRTDLLRQAGGYREDMSLYEDYELALRISKEIEFYATGQVGTAYRIKNNGLSDKPWQYSDKVFWHIFREYARELVFPVKAVCYGRKVCSWMFKRAKTFIYDHLVNINKGC